MTKSIRSATGDDEALRRELWGLARERLSLAMVAGFHVEAVALEDSMISDRLEDLLGMHKDRIAMNTIGQLAQLSRGLDADAFGALADRILQWAERRNVVVHQMVKVGPTHHGDWDERLAQARQAAEDGLVLLDDVDGAVRRYAAGTTTPPPAEPG